MTPPSDDPAPASTPTAPSAPEASPPPEPAVPVDAGEASTTAKTSAAVAVVSMPPADLAAAVPPIAAAEVAVVAGDETKAAPTPVSPPEAAPSDDAPTTTRTDGRQDLETAQTDADQPKAEVTTASAAPPEDDVGPAPQAAVATDEAPPPTAALAAGPAVPVDAGPEPEAAGVESQAAEAGYDATPVGPAAAITPPVAPSISPAPARNDEPVSGPVQAARNVRLDGTNDFYFFDDAGSDPRLAWFEASVARQMRDAHPGDAPGCHDRWLLWLTKGRTVVAAAWDSRDSRGRPRTPLFAAIAVEQSVGASFVRDAAGWLDSFHRTVGDSSVRDREAFAGAVRSAAAEAQSLDLAGPDDAGRPTASRAAHDVLRAVGLSDLDAAASLFPQSGLAAKLKRAGRMLRALSGKAAAESASPPACADGHCRLRQEGVGAAASLEGWAALAVITRQTAPLGIVVGENGVVDLFAAKPEAADLSGVYAAPADEPRR